MKCDIRQLATAVEEQAFFARFLPNWAGCAVEATNLSSMA